VLSCNIASPARSDAHKGLDREKKVGFATVVILDAAGEVIARLKRTTSLEDFRELGRRADAHLAVRKRAAEGEGSAKIDLALDLVELGRSTASEAAKQVAAAATPSKERRARLDRLLANEETTAILRTITRAKSTWIEAGRRIAEMRKAGRLPDDDQRYWSYCGALADYAESVRDAALFEEALREARERSARYAGMEKTLGDLEARLKALKGE
jgi:hypothetical protein